MKELLAALTGFFSHDEAFGLPKGSIRGMVFLIMTATVCLLASKQQPIPAELAAAWGGIVGLYFGGKGNGNGHGTPPPATP